jgi:uncharacterized phiE125 gp8 family phage protein
MMLVEETRVPDAALPLADFKEHLRLGSGFADGDVQDGLLATYLRAALAAVEARTGKILIERSFVWTVTGWRDGEAEVLPVAPVNALIDVILIGRDGEENLVATSRYRLVPDLQAPLLRGAGLSLPVIPAAGSARVRFLAGYGPEWIDLPPDLAQAVFMLAAHYYEFRHDTTGPIGVPSGVAGLIERFRTIRLSAGRGRA